MAAACFRKRRKSGRRRDIETGDEAVAGIEAEADGDIEVGGDQLADVAQFLELAAELRSSTGGIFQQDGEPRAGGKGRVYRLPGLGERFGHVDDAFFDGKSFIVAGVRDEVVGSDEDGAFDLAGKAEDRFLPDFAGRRSEIDEIAVVNDQRLDVVKQALFG